MAAPGYGFGSLATASPPQKEVTPPPPSAAAAALAISSKLGPGSATKESSAKPASVISFVPSSIHQDGAKSGGAPFDSAQTNGAQQQEQHDHHQQNGFASDPFAEGNGDGGSNHQRTTRKAWGTPQKNASPAPWEVNGSASPWDDEENDKQASGNDPFGSMGAGSGGGASSDPFASSAPSGAFGSSQSGGADPFGAGPKNDPFAQTASSAQDPFATPQRGGAVAGAGAGGARGGLAGAAAARASRQRRLLSITVPRRQNPLDPANARDDEDLYSSDDDDDDDHDDGNGSNDDRIPAHQHHGRGNGFASTVATPSHGGFSPMTMAGPGATSTPLQHQQGHQQQRTTRPAAFPASPALASTPKLAKTPRATCRSYAEMEGELALQLFGTRLPAFLVL